MTRAARSVLGNEPTVSKKTQELVPKYELGFVRIDVGDGMPFPVRAPDASGDDGVDVGVPLE